MEEHLMMQQVKDKSLLDCTNLFSASEYEKNYKIILKYFSLTKRLRWKNHVALFVVSIENLKNLKYQTSTKKQFFLLFAVNVKTKVRKYLKKKNQSRYQKLLAYLKIYNYFTGIEITDFQTPGKIFTIKYLILSNIYRTF